MIIFYCNGSALTVFLAVGYMKSIPRELQEAAIVDGCKLPMVFFRIVFPLMKPITSTSVIFNTMWIWNDFIAPNIFLSTRSKGTIVLEIFRAKGQFSVGLAKIYDFVCSCYFSSGRVLFADAEKYYQGADSRGRKGINKITFRVNFMLKRFLV